MRRGAWWLFIIVGGVLQYAYSETKHPSALLAVWAWIYRVLLAVAIVALVAWGATAVRERIKWR